MKPKSRNNKTAMRSIISTFFLLTIIVCLGTTNQTHAAKKEAPKKITFTTASWEKIKDQLYYQKGGTAKAPEYEQISLSVMSRSLPYEVKTSGYITFYKKTLAAEYAEVARVKTPIRAAGKNRYLLIFLPKKDNSHQIKVIPDGRHDSPFGAFCFYNLSKLPIKGVLAKDKFDLPAGDKKLVILKHKTGTPIPFATIAIIEGKRQWLQRNTFHFNPHVHSKCFIYQVPTSSGDLKVSAKFIVEFDQPEPNSDDS